VAPPAAAATAPVTRTPAQNTGTQTTLRGAVAEAAFPEEFIIVGDGEDLPF